MGTKKRAQLSAAAAAGAWGAIWQVASWLRPSAAPMSRPVRREGEARQSPQLRAAFDQSRNVVSGRKSVVPVAIPVRVQSSPPSLFARFWPARSSRPMATVPAVWDVHTQPRPSPQEACNLASCARRVTVSSVLEFLSGLPAADILCRPSSVALVVRRGSMESVRSAQTGAQRRGESRATPAWH